MSNAVYVDDLRRYFAHRRSNGLDFPVGAKMVAVVESYVGRFLGNASHQLADTNLYALDIKAVLRANHPGITKTAELRSLGKDFVLAMSYLDKAHVYAIRSDQAHTVLPHVTAAQRTALRAESTAVAPVREPVKFAGPHPTGGELVDFLAGADPGPAVAGRVYGRLKAGTERLLRRTFDEDWRSVPLDQAALEQARASVPKSSAGTREFNDLARALDFARRSQQIDGDPTAAFTAGGHDGQGRIAM